MPEGPSIVILKELTTDFVGRRVAKVEGNSKIEISRMQGEIIQSIRSWGKHFLLEFSGFALRVHLLMFGSYMINDRKEAAPRLSLQMEGGGELNFYACSVKYIEGPLDDAYDWSIDVMSPSWDAKAARKKLAATPEKLLCDAALDQTIFSGAGNIFKNEVLFRIRVHPLSQVGALSAGKLREFVQQMHNYAFEFLEWKKAYVLRQHWLAHNKSICPRCNIPFTRAYLGKTHRRSFFCEKCQKRYALDS